ncbi:MAG: hypothetical protein HXY45_18920 [Syntrophaceae bacterium]|nr:hypothetical protein [Syntrophaceae bacterium]
MSFITPSVALAAFPAGTIAQMSSLKVGLAAFRLGGVIYILPFIFVFNPGLILQAGTSEVFQAVISAGLGVVLIGSSFEGYLLGVGWLHWGYRIAFFVAGMALSVPEWKTDLIGLIIALLTFGLARVRSARKKSIRA